MKLISGTSGVGFYKISYIDNAFFINDSFVNEKEMFEFLNNLEEYLVTEYLTSHHEISRIYCKSPNTVRVMVVSEGERAPIIANAFMRFGTKKTGVIDNGSAGGIFSIVDVVTGRFYDSKIISNYNTIKCIIHPDTKVIVEGTLPHWELIKTKLLEISNYLSELKYMGFDVVITEEGFKILEINSHQGINCFQYYYPLLKNNPAELFFKTLLNKKEMDK